MSLLVARSGLTDSLLAIVALSCDDATARGVMSPPPQWFGVGDGTEFELGSDEPCFLPAETQGMFQNKGSSAGLDLARTPVPLIVVRLMS